MKKGWACWAAHFAHAHKSTMCFLMTLLKERPGVSTSCVRKPGRQIFKGFHNCLRIKIVRGEPVQVFLLSWPAAYSSSGQLYPLGTILPENGWHINLLFRCRATVFPICNMAVWELLMFLMLFFEIFLSDASICIYRPSYCMLMWRHDLIWKWESISSKTKIMYIRWAGASGFVLFVRLSSH